MRARIPAHRTLHVVLRLPHEILRALLLIRLRARPHPLSVRLLAYVLNQVMCLLVVHDLPFHLRVLKLQALHQGVLAHIRFQQIILLVVNQAGECRYKHASLVPIKVQTLPLCVITLCAWMLVVIPALISAMLPVWVVATIFVVMSAPIRVPLHVGILVWMRGRMQAIRVIAGQIIV